MATSANDEIRSAVTVERDKDIVILTLNRPERANTLSEETLAALDARIAAVEIDPTVKAVVLASSSRKFFCTGHDLKELAAHEDDDDHGHAYFTDVFHRCSSVMQRLVDLPQPVIASVAGIATAAGAQLVASCDLAVACETSRFATPGVNIGLFCSTPAVALSRTMSRKHAMEMLLTGEFFDAQYALRVGLVNRVTKSGGALDDAVNLAHLIASKSAQAIRIGKAAYRQQQSLDLSSAYAHASATMVSGLLTPDAHEGISAFVQKRAPKWVG